MNQLTKILGSGIVTVLMAVAIFYAVGQHTEIMAEETEKQKYKFADDIMVTAVFTFRDGVEIVNLEAFTQGNGFDVDTAPGFTIIKAAGNTPMLYEAADQAHKYSKDGVTINHIWRDFDAEVIISQNGKVLRSFEYNDCKIADYKVDTLFDKEEGWHGKGFAVTEEFEFQCEGYDLINVAYNDMKKNGVHNADTVSSKDLRQTQDWTDVYKYFK